MKVYFLSDLHLENGQEPKARKFCSLLDSLSTEDILILGGDVFDLLVGNKRLFRDRFEAPISAINGAAERGVQVHYVEGNHDFHFQGVFSPLVKIHLDDFEISAFGRRTWVSHGDLIDETDTGYRFLRAFTKNPPFRAFVKAMPDAVVDFIGSRSSGASRKYTTIRPESMVTERLRKIYLDFALERVRAGFRHVLIGHSHLADQVPISVEGKKGEYLNLGFSKDQLLYAVLEDGMDAFVKRTD